VSDDSLGRDTVDGGGGAGGSAEPADGRTFEQIVEELEAVAEQLAGGQIGIEEAAELYERAQRLHALARHRLEAVQARVDRLTPPAP
jgi:exodeoxyribonuclease VII small subunit